MGAIKEMSMHKGKKALMICFLLLQYNLEKPTNEDFEEEEDDEDYGAARKVEEPEEDPIEGIIF